MSLPRGVTSAGRLAAFVVLALAACSARALTLEVGPGNHLASPGAEVDFAFRVSGDAANRASNFRFRIAYDSATGVYEPVLKPGSPQAVQCTMEPGLEGFTDLVNFFPDRTPGVIVVSFADTSEPLAAFGEARAVARCRFRIRPDAPFGTYPLPCSGQPTAGSINEGEIIDAVCSDGSLRVVPPPALTLNIGPGSQVGSPGQETDFVFAVGGDAVTRASNFRFRIRYDRNTAVYEPVRKSGSADAVRCTMEPGLEGFADLVNFFPDRDPGVIVVSFADVSEPLAAFGSARVVARCRFRIKAAARIGIYPLACEGESSAGAVNDQERITAVCTDGTLSVVPPSPTPSPTPTPTATPPPACTGDETRDGSVDGDEVNDAIRAFTLDDVSFNPAADTRGPDGAVDGDELNRVIRNFTRDECVLLR